MQSLMNLMFKAAAQQSMANVSTGRVRGTGSPEHKHVFDTTLHAGLCCMLVNCCTVTLRSACSSFVSL